MGKTVQLIKGSSEQNNLYVGPEGSLTYDTDLKSVRVHDGQTPGGFNLPLKDEVDSSLDLKADKDNTLNHNQITNCILEIPELVDLTLDSEKLNIKEGSIFIIPYGKSAPTMSIGDILGGCEIVDISWDGDKLFYYVKTPYDYYINNTDTANDSIIYYVPDIGLGYNNISYVFSSTTTQTTVNTVWYNYSDNIIRKTDANGDIVFEYMSLPICIVKQNFASIKQIFQSIYYIGSTIFVGKGVKGLYPNGRNSDGTLKNDEYVVSDVKLYNFGGNANKYQKLFILTERMQGLGKDTIYRSFIDYVQESEPDTTEKSILVWYQPKENIYRFRWINSNITEWTPIKLLHFADYVGDSNNKVVDMRVKSPFYALDRNDTMFISNQSKPSKTRVSLTLGASSTNYYAPSDGWVVFRKYSSAAGQNIEIYTDNRVSPKIFSSAASQQMGVFAPVSKGELFRPYYSVAGDTTLFTFIYDNGAIVL